LKERDIIDQIHQLTGGVSDELLQGIGDDCAVIRKDGDSVWLLTMDTLLEGVHFDSSLHPPEQLAGKSLAVNISDIAAMGGKPLFVLLSLGLPRSFSEKWFEQFSSGMARSLAEYGCLLVGGDTVASPGGTALTLTVIGQARESEVLYRSSARVGDTIWVTGPLGLSAAGFELLRSGQEKSGLQSLVDAHLRPRARIGLGRKLGRSGLVHAMMDISDGLATDLAHLALASGVGAKIFAEKLVVHPELHRAAALLHRDPLDWMLQGGEDYELLFTAVPEETGALQRLATGSGQQLFAVGTIISGSGVTLVNSGSAATEEDEVSVSFQGFDHFR
jgi:thiamine-monophosphate kinase